GLSRLHQRELAERLLELLPDLVERTMGLRRDHGPDELECEANGTRLERRQPRRRAEGVSEQLLLDVHVVSAQLRVPRVPPAAEVDEVEQREVLLQGLGRNREALHQLRRGN